MPFSWLRSWARRFARSASHPSRRHKQRTRPPQLETLEIRDVPTVVFTPDYVVKTTSTTATPLSSTGPSGYSPAQISQAYGFNQISFNGTAGTGAGETIAIVDAYNDPTVRSDLHSFDQQFGLADPTFTVVNQNGGTSLPASNTDWAGEISLDVEWAHAMAPAAKILLVEANSASENDLFTAVQFAAKQSGVVAVSMSWGGSEFSGETSFDSSVFTPPATNPDVVFINSSGDSGAPASYPATSPNVLSVGGTSLFLVSSNNYSSEIGWSGSGGGISSFESQPSFQQGVVTQTTTRRASPDVSYDADPNTGFPVYQTYGNSSGGSWLQYGGTSDAAPQWAALVAIADQGRAIAGKAALSSSALLKDVYGLPSTDFHDVTSGSSTGSPTETAGQGYDLVTGRGTPIANLVVAGLVGTTNSATSVTHFSITAPTSAIAGTSFSVTIAALNSSNQPVTGYTGTVSITSSDGSAILPGSYTFTSADNGSRAFTITLKTTGTQSITVSDTATGASGQTSVAVSTPTFKVSGFPATVTAGAHGTITITAFAPNGTTLTNYSGTVHFTSSDPNAVLPANVTLTNGVGTFTVTFKTAGTQSITVTDVANPSMNGTELGITVNPGAATHLAFLQQPSNANVGGTIAPAVTVEELDQFNNVVTTDSTSSITLSLGSTSTGATLSGGGTMTFSHGIATFGGLSVNVAGTGYVLTASSGSLPSVTSAPFNVSTSTGTLLEGFENGLGNYYYTGFSFPFVGTSSVAAHDGSAGLVDEGDGNWYFRTDPAAQVNPGDSLSVWVQFAGSADGRAYFGFGTSMFGTLSVVLAPNTGQLLIQSNSGFSQYLNLAAANQTYSANQWYRVEVDWGTSGTVVAKLFGSDGATLLNSVSAATGDVTSGGFAFRAIGSTKYFDSVTVTRGVNNFAAPGPSIGALAGLTGGSEPGTTTRFGSYGSGEFSAGPTFGFAPPAVAGGTIFAGESFLSIGNPFGTSERKFWGGSWFPEVI